MLCESIKEKNLSDVKIKYQEWEIYVLSDAASTNNVPWLNVLMKKAVFRIKKINKVCCKKAIKGILNENLKSFL